MELTGRPPDPVKRMMLKATPPIGGMKRVWTGSLYDHRPMTASELARRLASKGAPHR
jgi:hypothetical protein